MKAQNTLRKKQIQEMSADYFWSSFTSLRTKGYVHNSIHSRHFAIVPVSEVTSTCFLIFFQNISPFSKRIKLKVADMFFTTAKGNAQRNKLSLHAQKSSGITHFRKTHLKRREVVMCETNHKIVHFAEY